MDYASWVLSRICLDKDKLTLVQYFVEFLDCFPCYSSRKKADLIIKFVESF